MPDDGLDIQVERFIDEHLNSVAQLELLLLLQQTKDQRWCPEDLARELRVECPWAEGQLKGFARAGLIAPAEEGKVGYSFAPRELELERAVAALSRAYLLQRVRVIERIYGRSSSRIRAFADAFRLKKEHPDG